MNPHITRVILLILIILFTHGAIQTSQLITLTQPWPSTIQHAPIPPQTHTPEVLQLPTTTPPP